MTQKDTFRASAPCRISLAGGGTDVSPFVDERGGAVVSLSIDRFMSAELAFRDDGHVVIRSNIRPDSVIYESVAKMRTTARLGFVSAIAQEMYDGPKGFELALGAAVPSRSGLGGSGAMAVAVVSAFDLACGRQLEGPKEIAEFAYRIETEVIGNATGRQDQYAAAFGGVNLVEFSPKGTVTPLPMGTGRDSLPRLREGLVLFWVGQRGHDSGKINGHLPSSGPGLEALLRTKAMVPAMWEAVKQEDIQCIGNMLDSLWAEKKRFNASVSNERIDAIYTNLKAAGMLGGKITGAGGGGHMISCCRPEDRERMVASALGMGLKEVPFTFADSCLTPGDG